MAESKKKRSAGFYAGQVMPVKIGDKKFIPETTAPGMKIIRVGRGVIKPSTLIMGYASR